MRHGYDPDNSDCDSLVSTSIVRTKGGAKPGAGVVPTSYRGTLTLTSLPPRVTLRRFLSWDLRMTVSLSPSLYDNWMSVGVECEIRMEEAGMLGSFECVTIIAINKGTTVTVEYVNLFDDNDKRLIEETSVRQLRPKCRLLIPDLFVESLQINSKCQMRLDNSSWWTMKVVSKSSSEACFVLLLLSFLHPQSQIFSC